MRSPLLYRLSYKVRTTRHIKFLSSSFLYYVVLFNLLFHVNCLLNRHERTQVQQLRDEQDEAYLESVRADQEKVSLCKAPSTRIRIFLNPELFLSGSKDFQSRPYVTYSNRICPSTCILIRSSIQDSSFTIVNQPCAIRRASWR